MATIELKFRLIASLIVATVGSIATANAIADILGSRWIERVSASNEQFPGANYDGACRASAFGVARTDLKVDCALTRANRALISRGSERELEEALSTCVATIRNAPHDSRLWLAFALLEAQANRSSVAALKMSYLTAPSAVELIPVRLATVTKADALKDEDLQALAGGDIRLILTKRPDMNATIVEAYRQASALGKSFIEEKTAPLNPKVGQLLRDPY